jgi:hypothetical protein
MTARPYFCIKKLVKNGCYIYKNTRKRAKNGVCIIINAPGPEPDAQHIHKHRDVWLEIAITQRATATATGAATATATATATVIGSGSGCGGGSALHGFLEPPGLVGDDYDGIVGPAGFFNGDRRVKNVSGIFILP